MTNEKAPERIYMHPTSAEANVNPWPLEPGEYVEYVRADLAVPAGAAPQVVSDVLRDAGAIIIVNEGDAGARVEIRFAELRDAQRLHKTLIQARATAAPVEQSDEKSK